MADRPHVLTISLSICAVIISLFSYIQSREAARFAKLSSEASVQVTRLRLIAPYRPGQQLKADLELANFGKLAAQDVYVTLTGTVDTEGGILEHAKGIDREGHFITFGELPAGAARTIRHWTDTLPAKRPEEIISKQLTVILYGVVRYKDATGKAGRNVYAFCVSPTTLEELGVGELARCQFEPDWGPILRAQPH